MNKTEVNIFLNGAEKIAKDLEQNSHKLEILSLYQDISKTNAEIINEFFPTLPKKKMSIYLKALYFLAKNNLSKEIIESLSLLKKQHHAKKWGSYYQSLVEYEWEEFVHEQYHKKSIDSAVKRWINVYSDKEREYIINQKILWTSNKSIAEYCNIQFHNNELVRKPDTITKRFVKQFPYSQREKIYIHEQLKANQNHEIIANQANACFHKNKKIRKAKNIMDFHHANKEIASKIEAPKK